MNEIGNLYVIAAPSGTGKTTLVKALVESLPKVTVSISHTTRPKRPNEVNGVHYYFITPEEFEQKIAEGNFLEYARIFDNCYGTSKLWVMETLRKGRDVILEIDWQGNQQIKKLFPESVGIFVLPPSLKDLRDRLVKRNQDHADIIRKRLADVKQAVGHLDDFEYLVVNDDFSHALNDLKSIIEAGRLLRFRQKEKYANLITDLANFTS